MLRKAALQGGVIRTVDLRDLKIHHRILPSMRDAGEFEQIARGIYALPDLFLSALDYYDLTKQIPKDLTLAVPKGCKPRSVAYPPMHFFWFTSEHYNTEIEVIHRIQSRGSLTP